MLEDFNNISKAKIYELSLERMHESEVKRKLMENIDRSINNKIDYDFINRRKVDPKVRQLVQGLKSYDNVFLLTKYFFPPQLIFLDKELTKDQVQIALQKLNMKEIYEGEKSINNKEFNEMKNVCLHILIYLFRLQ